MSLVNRRALEVDVIQTLASLVLCVMADAVVVLPVNDLRRISTNSDAAGVAARISVDRTSIEKTCQYVSDTLQVVVQSLHATQFPATQNDSLCCSPSHPDCAVGSTGVQKFFMTEMLCAFAICILKYCYNSLIDSADVTVLFKAACGAKADDASGNSAVAGTRQQRESKVNEVHKPSPSPSTFIDLFPAVLHTLIATYYALTSNVTGESPVRNLIAESLVDLLRERPFLSIRITQNFSTVIQSVDPYKLAGQDVSDKRCLNACF